MKEEEKYKMKLTFSQLLQIQQIYPINDKLPFKTAYTFAKLGEVIEQELKFYYTKMNEVISEYSIKDADSKPELTPDGNSIKIDPNKLEECQKQLEELHNVEVDIGDITFTEEALEALTLTTQQAFALMPLIK